MKFLFTGITIAVLVAIGAIRRARHLHLVAGLLALLAVLAAVERINVGWAVAVAGTPLLAIGVIRLRRFLRENPVLPQEIGHE